MSKQLTFQTFDNPETAHSVAQTLKQHGIDATVEQNPSLLDSNFIGQDFGNHILVKLWPQDFERAQKILLDSTVIDMNEVDRNYMLFQMTDKELEGVLASPEEWGAWNYKLAMLILAERGVTVTDQHAATLQETHVQSLTEPQKISGVWLLLGYSFSVLLLVAAFLPAPFALATLFSFKAILALLGAILGLVLIGTRKTLPDGRSIPAYDKNARNHGWGMLLFCLFAVIFSVAMIILRVSG